MQPALTYTLRDASALIGLSQKTLRNRINDGSLKSVLCGSRRLILGQSLFDLIEQSPTRSAIIDERTANASRLALRGKR